MRLGHGRQLSLGVLLALVALAIPCRGATAPYDLEYEADAGCPDRAAFEALVQAQLDEAREPTPATHAHASVRLRRDRDHAAASFELVRPDGSRYVRELASESCEAAAQGLAFVLAFALGGGDPENAPLPQIPAPGAAREPAPTPGPQSPAPAVAVPVVVVPPPTSKAPSSASWRFGIGAQLGVRTGLGPIWTPVEVGLLDARWSGRPVLSPAFRVAVAHAEPITRIDARGTTTFGWLAGRVEACPVQLLLVPTRRLTRSEGSVRLLPCVAAHLGRMTAAGEPRAEAGATGRTARQPWVDALVALRLELSLWRVLQLETQGELIVPLTPYRFAFDHPDTSVYVVPSVAFAGFVGVGVHFP